VSIMPHLLLLHPDPTLGSELAKEIGVLSFATSCQDADLSQPFDVFVCSSEVAGWDDLICRLRQVRPGLRVAVQPKDLHDACRAANELRVDMLLPVGGVDELRLALRQMDPSRGEPEELLPLAVRVDRLICAGKMAGSLAHEINNPMTGIMVFAESLAERTDPGTVLNDQAAEILKGARRCRTLIHSLLRFARRARDKHPVEVDLSAAVQEVQVLVQHRADLAGVRLELLAPREVPRVRSRPADLEHLLVAVLLSAIEATPTGGSVRLTVQELGKEKMIELQVSGQAGAVAGTSPKARPVEVSQDLAACDYLVHASGGALRAERLAGAGLKVALQFPSAADQGES